MCGAWDVLGACALVAVAAAVACFPPEQAARLRNSMTIIAHSARRGRAQGAANKQEDEGRIVLLPFEEWDVLRVQRPVERTRRDRFKSSGAIVLGRIGLSLASQNGRGLSMKHPQEESHDDSHL
jgi:hypothetical protein